MELQSLKKKKKMKMVKKKVGRFENKPDLCVVDRQIDMGENEKTKGQRKRC